MFTSRGKFLQLRGILRGKFRRIARGIARQLRGIRGELRGLRGIFLHLNTVT